MYYTQQENRLIQTGERMYAQAYGRFGIIHPSTRSEVGLRFMLGQSQLRGSRVLLSRGPLESLDSSGVDLGNATKAVLAKVRYQHKTEIQSYVVTASRTPFTVPSLSTLYRIYRSMHARGGMTGWPAFAHESVVYSMYVLFETNAPAVFAVNHYTSLLSALALQMHEVEHGDFALSAVNNDVVLNTEFDMERPTFSDPDETSAKRRRMTCRLCGTQKITAVPCRVCGYTPRRS